MTILQVSLLPTEPTSMDSQPKQIDNICPRLDPSPLAAVLATLLCGGGTEPSMAQYCCPLFYHSAPLAFPWSFIEALLAVLLTYFFSLHLFLGLCLLPPLLAADILELQIWWRGWWAGCLVHWDVLLKARGQQYPLNLWCFSCLPCPSYLREGVKALRPPFFNRPQLRHWRALVTPCQHINGKE